MTLVNLAINTEFIDGWSISKNSDHFDGKVSVFLCHRIGSVKDQFGRPIGKFTSGKGIADDVVTAYSLAESALITNVALELERQNANPPKTSAGLASDEAELFALLELPHA